MKTIKTILFAAFLSGTVYAQAPYYWGNAFQDTTANFYEIVDTVETYAGNNTPYKSGATMPDYKKFLRWKLYWENKVSEYNGNGGSFHPILTAAADLWDNPVCNTDPNNGSDWKSIGPNQSQMTNQHMGVAWSIAYDDVDKIIYAGSNGGLWKSLDTGKTWNNITDSVFLPGLGVTDIVIDPFDNEVLYIATGNGTWNNLFYGIGVLKSTDQGQTWTKTSISNDPSERISVNKIVADPENQGTFFIATSEREGFKKTFLYKSTNDLDSVTKVLQLTATESRRVIRDIVFEVDSSDIMYLSTDNGRGKGQGCMVLKSDENGDLGSWTDISANFEEQIFTYLVDGVAVVDTAVNMKYTDRVQLATAKDGTTNITYGIYVVRSGDGSRDGFYLDRSTDGGDTWEGILIYDDSTYLRNFVDPNQTYGVARMGGTGFWGLALEASVNDPNVIYVGGHAMDKITIDGDSAIASHSNAGSSSADMHVDIRDIVVFDDGGVDQIIIGNDGGISMSTDSAATWSSINGAYATGYFQSANMWGIGISEFDADLTIGGSQHNSALRHNDSIWGKYGGGDMGDMAVHPTRPNIMFSQQWSNDLATMLIDTTGGTSFFNANSSRFVNGQDLGSFKQNSPMEFGADGKLYIGTYDVYSVEIPDPYDSLIRTRLSDFATSLHVLKIHKITAIGVAPSDVSTMYAAVHYKESADSSFHGLFKTTDGGQNWSDISPSVLGQYVKATDIEINPGNADEIWIALNGIDGDSEDTSLTAPFTGINRVLHYTTATQWNDVSSGLTEMPVNKITYQKGTNNRLYAGTDAGIFYREGGSDWECFNHGMPIDEVTDIEINYCAGKIRASTYNRGVWENDLLPVDTMVYGDFSSTEIDSNQTMVSESIVYPGNLVVKQGVTLQIFSSDLQFFDGAKIVVEPLATLKIVNSTISGTCDDAWDGLIEIQDFGKLDVIGDLSEIRLKRGGKIDVTRGLDPGELHITGNPQFLLRDNETQIRIDGELELVNNTSVFSVMQQATDSSYGHILFDTYYEINAHPDSKIELIGVDQYHPLIEVAKNITLSIDSFEIEVNNAEITFNQNTELKVENNTVDFTNVHFNGVGGNSTGLHVLNNNAFAYLNCSASNLNRGLWIENDTLTKYVINSKFHSCNTGIETDSINDLVVIGSTISSPVAYSYDYCLKARNTNSIILTNSTFSGTEIGVWLLDVPSCTLNNSTVDYADQGIFANRSDVIINNGSIIENCFSAVAMYGSTSLLDAKLTVGSSGCGHLINNQGGAVVLGQDFLIDIDQVTHGLGVDTIPNQFYNPQASYIFDVCYSTLATQSLIPDTVKARGNYWGANGPTADMFKIRDWCAKAPTIPVLTTNSATSCTLGSCNGCDVSGNRSCGEEAEIEEIHDAETVTGSVTWQEEHHVLDTLIISAGSTLIMDQADVTFGDHSKIIIERDGKLVISSSNLSACGASNVWQGIEVLGNNTKAQTAKYQATLDVDNSTITDASVAVYAGERDINGVDVSGTGGGIVEVSKSTFHNNGEHIHFAPYTYASNSSFISQNTFDIDTLNPAFGGEPVHVNVNSIESLLVDDNSFEGGIKGVFLDKCTNVNIDKNSFSHIDTALVSLEDDGLIFHANNISDCTRGVYALDGVSLSIDSNTFVDFHTGVELTDALESEIIENSFENGVYGIISNNGEEMYIEDNEFDSVTYSITINGGGGGERRRQTGRGFDLITFNTITGSDIAIQFKNESLLKLKIECNNFIDYKQYAIKSDSTTLPSIGKASESAGNQFISASGNQYDAFYHNAGNAIDYYYSPTDSIKFIGQNMMSNNISRKKASKDKVCVRTARNSVKAIETSKLKKNTPLTTSTTDGDIQLSVYPNPNNGQFTLEISGLPENGNTMIITNYLGQQVFSKKDMETQSRLEIDLGNSATGVYHIMIYDKNGAVISEEKMIVE